ncbi:hypothetical protein I7I50_11166 [Histoplasma capsulatum G186AR]|uniref:Uncharacterized protein n=1 Tax=Ajellomyces capsulatus TaxID=5037 RepID=A0A8H7Z7G1_AJECA|nr:hypothetical protein I7I52_02404 [Histoplasma capsulatum]QSS69760.1 hypothetical protein I7I50_11166 [Histoplasma capsulatum G186AR]
MTQELGPTVGLVERSRAIPATLWGSTDRERIGVISERDANNTMGRFKCFDFRWFKVLSVAGWVEIEIILHPAFTALSIHC